ncbi:MAG: tetratricopeptide repeat protein [Acidobacteriota bacterium]
MKTIYLKSMCIIVVLVLASSFSFGQAGRGTGRLKGNVTDQKNKPLKGTRITLIFLDEDGDPRTTISNNKGIWTFIGLGYGKYDITAEKEGFDSMTKRTMISQMNRNPFMNLKLKVSEKEKVKKKILSIEHGLKLYKEKKIDEALIFFKDFSKKNPEYYQVNLFVGDCLKEKEEYSKAIEKYILLNELANKTNDRIFEAKGLARIGEVYILKNDLEKAQHYFKKSIEVNPKDEILAYNVGEIYFGNNNPDGAIKYYKLATEIKPGWAVPYVKLGYAFLNKGDIPSAVTNFNKFLEIDKDSPEAETIKEILKSL